MRIHSSIALFAISFVLASFAARGQDAPVVIPKVHPEGKVTDDEVEMANIVLAKRFCVALRRKDHSAMREMIDPEYLKGHGIIAKTELPIQIAPVLGIHNILSANEGSTVLCLYSTGDGEKEAMILRTAWREGRLFIVPGCPPDPESKRFKPWILRTNLDGFVDGQ